MWYKIWTFVVESIPMFVLGLIFTVIAAVFVVGTVETKCPRCGYDLTIQE